MMCIEKANKGALGTRPSQDSHSSDVGAWPPICSKGSAASSSELTFLNDVKQVHMLKHSKHSLNIIHYYSSTYCVCANTPGANGALEDCYSVASHLTALCTQHTARTSAGAVMFPFGDIKSTFLYLAYIRFLKILPTYFFCILPNCPLQARCTQLLTIP